MVPLRPKAMLPKYAKLLRNTFNNVYKKLFESYNCENWDIKLRQQRVVYLISCVPFVAHSPLPSPHHPLTRNVTDPPLSW